MQLKETHSVCTCHIINMHAHTFIYCMLVHTGNTELRSLFCKCCVLVSALKFPNFPYWKLTGENHRLMMMGMYYFGWVDFFLLAEMFFLPGVEFWRCVWFFYFLLWLAQLRFFLLSARSWKGLLLCIYYIYTWESRRLWKTFFFSCVLLF